MVTAYANRRRDRRHSTLMAQRKHEPGPPMDLANMRGRDVRSLLCSAVLGGHWREYVSRRSIPFLL